jgi:protein-disulfide isomerase
MLRIALAAALPLLVVSCATSKPASPPPEKPAPDLVALAERVDGIDQRLARIEKLLADALDQPKEPDPEVVYSVDVAGDPFVGPADAKVTIVKAFEFACGFCYRSRPTLAQIREAYGDDVRIVYKYFVIHDQAVGPGLAACAAHKQGKFEEMKELIWDKGFAEQDIGQEKMNQLAREAGLDMPTFVSDLASEPCMSWLKSGYAAMSRLGVRGTPAFFVNGRFISGAQPFEVFKKVIDEELARANRAIAGGVPAADYYQTQVVAKGQKELE